jgi:hypothetical protein
MGDQAVEVLVLVEVSVHEAAVAVMALIIIVVCFLGDGLQARSKKT